MGQSTDLTRSPAQGQPCRGLGRTYGFLSQWSVVRGTGGRPGLALLPSGLLNPLGLSFHNFSLLCITFKMLAMVIYS